MNSSFNGSTGALLVSADVGICDARDKTEVHRSNVPDQKYLCRMVFDDLFERDLLGFLLSSRHLSRHMQELASRCDPFTARQIERVLCAVDLAESFHAAMLEMYSGIHVKESSLGSPAALKRDLDEKLKRSLSASDGDPLFQVSQHEINRVELAWTYRHACESGAHFLPK